MYSSWKALWSMKNKSCTHTDAALQWFRISCTMIQWPVYYCAIAVWCFMAKKWMSYWRVSQITPVFQNGVLSALPYLAMWLFSMFISHVADWMISSNRFSITVTRKIINTIGKSTLHSTGHHNTEMMKHTFYNYDLSFLGGTHLPSILTLYCVNQTLILY